MKRVSFRKPSPALVISILALIVSMAGTGYAAITLPKNSVGSEQIKTGGVKSAEIAQNAVSTGEIKSGGVTASDIRANAVTSAKVADGSLLATDFKAGQLPAGPKGDKGDPGTVDTSNFYDKATSDARFIEVRSIDVNQNVGNTKTFTVGTIQFESDCNSTTGAQILVKASSSTTAIVGAAWSISTRGGGGTTPVAGRWVLTGTQQNLFFATNNEQNDGIFTFRTPGKVISMTFHASATTVDNTCEFHGTISEPTGAPIG